MGDTKIRFRCRDFGKVVEIVLDHIRIAGKEGRLIKINNDLGIWVVSITYLNYFEGAVYVLGTKLL